MPDLPYIWRPSDNYTRGRSSSIRCILVHSTCGREAGDLETLCHSRRPNRVSAHWYVTRTGKVYHLVANGDTAWHAGQTIDDALYGNGASIGIEQEHFDPDSAHPNGEDWPLMQIRAVAEIITSIRQQLGQRDLPVYSHHQAAPTRKSDPAAYPWGILRAEAQRAVWEGVWVPIRVVG